MTGSLNVFVFSLAVLLALGSGCTDEGPLAGDDAVLIRIANEGPAAFDWVEIGFPSGSNLFSRVEPDRKTSYSAFESAYRYGHVRAKTANEIYELRPIDYVGETPVEPGRYTYVLSVRDGELHAEMQNE